MLDFQPPECEKGVCCLSSPSGVLLEPRGDSDSQCHRSDCTIIVPTEGLAAVGRSAECRRQADPARTPPVGLEALGVVLFCLGVFVVI